MDKEMIHIDDLIRQRLGGGEEEARSGSWANMRSLLDKEMPVNPVASNNWRKYTSLIAALLLVSAVTVGGYKAIQSGYISMPGSHKSGDNNIASNNTGNNHHHGDNANTVAASSAAATTDRSGTQQANNENNNIDQTNKTSNTNTVAVQPTTNKANTVNNTNQQTTNNTTNNNTPTNAPVAGGMASAAHNQEIRNEKNTDVIAKHATTSPLNANKTGNGNANSTAIATVATTNTAVTELPKKAADRTNQNPGSHNGGLTPGTAVVNNNNNVVNNVNGSTSATKDAAAGKMLGNTASNAPDHLSVRQDTIELINLISRTVTNPYTGKKRVFIDTETIERRLVDRPIPAPYALEVRKPKTQVQNTTEIVPASAATASMATADGAGNLEPLSNHRVSTRKAGWDPQRFEEMFMQVKYNLGKIKFYPGITGGVNTSFINGFMPGIHLGLNGNVVFNDTWSVMTELKYNNRFNNRTQINDNYSRGLYDLEGTTPGQRIYVRDSFEHYFNFSSLGSVELPIMLRYSTRQFFVSAGVNLIYNLGVNVEELNTPQRIYDTLSISAPRPVDVNSKISAQDFGARFGVGYVFGVGYQFTPAISLDLRMSQTFWDNMSGAGAQNVSKQLFFKPAAQLSVGYRFGQRQH